VRGGHDPIVLKLPMDTPEPLLSDVRKLSTLRLRGVFDRN
jgi:hypothetical protein